MFRRLNVSDAAAKMAISATPGGAGAIESGQIRHERGVARRRPARDAGEHLGGVGHLRHPFRADERGDFDHRQAGRRQPVDELDLVAGRDRRLSFCRPSRGPTSTTVTRAGNGMAHSMRTHRPLLEVDERNAWLDQVAGRAVHSGHRPVGRRAHRQLHLHRFEYDQRIALPDAIARRSVHPNDARRHRRGEGATWGSRSWSPTLALELEFEDLAVEEHPARLAGGCDPRRAFCRAADSHLSGAHHLHFHRCAVADGRRSVAVESHSIFARAATEDDRSVSHGSPAPPRQRCPGIESDAGSIPCRCTASVGRGCAGTTGHRRRRHRAVWNITRSDQILEVLVDEPGVQMPRAEIRVAQDSTEERDIRPDAEDRELAQRARSRRAIAASRVSAVTISFASSGS